MNSLLKLYRQDKYIGLIMVSGKEMHCYKVSENEIINLKKTTTKLQKNQKKGGQSAQRIERIGKEKRARWINDIGDHCVDLYYDFDNNRLTVECLVLCGPSEIKKDLCKSSNFAKWLEPHVIKILPLSTSKLGSSDELLSELRTLCIEEYIDFKRMEDDKQMSTLLNMMITDDNTKMVFGEKDIHDELMEYGLKEIYIHSELYDDMDHPITTLLNSDDNVAKVIAMNNDKLLSDYGGLIGIKWY